jgi:5-deoxy-glucuronate isomerase
MSVENRDMSAKKGKALLYKAHPMEKGYNPIISSANSSLKLLEFGRIRLGESQQFRASTGEREVCLTFLSGTGEVGVSGSHFEAVSYHGVGKRRNVFQGDPNTVYIPRHAEYRVKASAEELHVAVFTAPARKDTLPFVLRDHEIPRRSFGAANWQREACITLSDEEEADRLLVGETYNAPGGWSSYPPHKHDASRKPKEEPYEEIYFFQMDPEDGFGMQRIYTDRDAAHPIDEALVVENGDTVVIPRGYHPVVAGAGYRLYYLWALAGEERRFGSWSDDPRHEWIRSLE